ncbi:hypothetical protein ACWC4J_43815, partial [Streptomyces sp. NPDC001356]
MRALARESARALRLVGSWSPDGDVPPPADAEAAAVPDRLTAAPPVRRTAAARARAMDRDRRHQCVPRTVLYRLHAG